MTKTVKRGGREKGKMQPVRDREKLARIKRWLLQNKGQTYEFLFHLGINTGLRVSDLLRLKVKDVKGKSTIFIIMEKTEKEVTVYLNTHLRSEIDKYVEFKKDEDFLFQSREGVNRPLTRQRVSQVFKEASLALEIERFNTHSMRKSFGYWYYKENKDVYYLMMLFGHNTQQQTLDYIGLYQEEVESTMQNFHL